MKRKNFGKKLVVLVMVTALVMALAACGDKPAGDSGTSGDNGDSGAAVLKLGGIAPLTGPAALYGVAVKQGATIAVEEINASGGAFSIELNCQDDEHDAEKAVNAYNNLKDWGMQVLMGTVTTSPCIAVAAEANADRMFQLTPSASSADVTAGKDNVFQMCFTDPNSGRSAANYMLDNNLGTKIAAIYNNADAYSAGVFNAFKAEMKSRGVELVYEGTYSSDDNADFSVQLNGAKAAGADMVFLPIYYTPASLILAQANSMGYEPNFFGVDGLDGILALEGFDTSLADGAMLLTPFNPWSTDEKVANFVKKYEEKFNETPNQFAADAYDAVYSIYNAMVEAGATPDMSSSELCETLINQFTTSFTYSGLTGSGMTWGTNGEVSKNPVVCLIEDGKYKDL